MQGTLGHNGLWRRASVYAAGLSLLAAFLASLSGIGVAPEARAGAPALAADHQTDVATIPQPLSVARNQAAQGPDLAGGRIAPSALPPHAGELPAYRPPAEAEPSASLQPGRPHRLAHRPRAPPRA